MGLQEIEIDLTKVAFPENAADEFKQARDQKKAEMSINGVSEENIKRVLPDEQWDSVKVSIGLLQNAIEQLYYRKYFSKERRIVVAPQAIRDMKAFLFRKMKRDGQFKVTLPELQLFVEALQQDLQAMDGYSYVSEYINQVAGKALAGNEE